MQVILQRHLVMLLLNAAGAVTMVDGTVVDAGISVD